MHATLRPAAPGDAPAAARLMYLAAKSHVDKPLYDLMFPGSMEETLGRLAALFNTEARSWYHHSHYLVAEVDGEVAGCLCGFNDLESGRSRLRDAFIEIGIDRAEGKAMYERTLPFHRVNPGHYEDSWVVEHAAVFPRFRGRGIMTSLLSEVLARGRRSGYKCAELNMLIGNVPALGAYEKAGFVVVEENTDDEFMAIFKCPGMARLYMEL